MSRDLASVAREAANCEACPLYRRATQTVFGDGPVPAPMMLVGEQPGDREDRTGHPFVGPAGRVLNEAFDAAGLDRSMAYVTNAVKHFKWTAKGKRRIHQKPDAGEIAACGQWLDRELDLVQPSVLVAMGTTAVRALLDTHESITRLRRTIHGSRWDVPTVVTIHPSSVLRQREHADRAAQLDVLVEDLRLAADTTERGDHDASAAVE